LAVHEIKIFGDKLIKSRKGKKNINKVSDIEKKNINQVSDIKCKQNINKVSDIKCKKNINKVLDRQK
jgi:hypothetical protein